MMYRYFIKSYPIFTRTHIYLSVGVHAEPPPEIVCITEDLKERRSYQGNEGRKFEDTIACKSRPDRPCARIVILFELELSLKVNNYR